MRTGMCVIGRNASGRVREVPHELDMARRWHTRRLRPARCASSKCVVPRWETQETTASRVLPTAEEGRQPVDIVRGHDAG